MKTMLECVYKGIKEIKAGSFTDPNGKVINYPDSYKIVIDEIVNDRAITRELKIKKEIALNLTQNIKLYDKISIALDVYFLNNNLVYKITNVGIRK